MIKRSMSKDNPTYELYYWPGIQGRGEYIRLMFVEAGVDWIEKNKEDGENTVVDFAYKGGNKNWPIFAVPALKYGDFVLSQMTAILQYLGKKFNLCADNDEDEAHVLSIALGVADFLMEGQNAFHPIDTHGRYLDQKEEADKCAAKFAQTRLAKWLSTFEKQLSWNNNGVGFMIGNKCTYADLAVFQVVSAAESQFPEELKKCDNIPLLKAHQKRIGERPNIKAYIASNRREKFGTDSMM